jgi:tetratricopeptide (TPR) repeat protein
LRSDPNTDGTDEAVDALNLAGRRVAFVGKLGGVNRREAHRLVRQCGGVPVDRCELPLDLVVLGAGELPLGLDDVPLPPDVQEAAGRGAVEIITETQFWHRLGLVDEDQHVRRLYTPAMLAELLSVPVATIRRWHRRGLIVPAREVHRLPYFDFQEVATARRLAELLAAGATPSAIERQLQQLACLIPEVERPLAQLSVIVQGRALLLRQGAGLIDAGGQRRFDFPDDGASIDSIACDAPAHCDAEASLASRPIRPWLTPEAAQTPSCDEIVAVATELEDEGRLAEAIDMYRLALVAWGPRADLCFCLAELLYLSGDITAARERYSMAIELDEDYVEARANLGCVLAETGQHALAIAAFQGALQSHRDYPDAHYHLAQLLDDVGDSAAAEHHWRQFLELAPDSPWADEARIRLETPWP